MTRPPDSGCENDHFESAAEHTEHEHIESPERPERHIFRIRIDRAEYEVHQKYLTGLQLRNLTTPPIGADRDLFEVVVGGSDRKIADHEKVEMRDGLRFFSAPAQINPGQA